MPKKKMKKKVAAAVSENPNARTTRFNMVVTAAERESIRAAAKKSGVKMAVYVRRKLGLEKA